MKTAIGIVLGVLIGIIIVTATIVSLLFVGLFPVNQEASSNNATSPSINFSSIVPPTPSPTVPPVTSQAPSPQKPAASSPTTTNPVTNNKDVNFSLKIISMSNSGFNYTATAEISNTGTTDAHNVRAEVEVFSQGSRIKVNGQNSLSITLGNITSSATLTTQAKLSFSVTDGPKILKNGATFKITVYSDEKTQTITLASQP